MMNTWHCRTILCVDDEESVLESYRQVLSISEEDTELADILAMADERSGDSSHTPKDDVPNYTLLFADSGAKAIEILRTEMAAGRRVAAGFFDMRMPGMDGYETIKALLELDVDLVCTVVTAYTDRSVTQIRELFSGSHQDQLLYFKKPFAPEELAQSALNMISSWNNKRRVEEYMRAIEKHKHGLSHILHAVGILSCVPPHSLQSMLTGLLFQFMAFLEADHGFAVFWPNKDGQKKLQYGIGRFENQENLHHLVEENPDFKSSLQINRCHIADNVCFVPLVSQAQQFGAMYIEAKRTVDIRIDRGLLEIFKTQMVQLILNSLYHQQAMMSEEESITDPLTGLYNRRFLMKVWRHELVRSTTTHMQLSVLMIDLDDFKKVNDTYGHEAGDAALRKVGNVLRLAVRSCDLLGLGKNLENIGKTDQYALRLGGEEFCVILMNTNGSGAQQVAERIRANIAKGGFIHKGEEVPLFASIGGWSGDVDLLELNDDDQLESYIDYADKALYHAKSTGKNRVVFYTDGMTWKT
ncbi:MAG: diguanylate cyclase [Desulfobulbaceae bacterium]|nr:diguanylate cyclase [Desulfobulbaceae bacterium]